MPDATHDSELPALLRVIDGTDFPYTQGLRSFPDATTPPPPEEDLPALLARIRGTVAPFTPGLRLNPRAADASSQQLHAGCLALEGRGLIRRWLTMTYPDVIIWRPVAP
jgi:hypothetical protein